MKYGKVYASKDEHQKRLQTFKENYEIIEKHNLQDAPFQMEVN